jgi:CRP-like cAMP-binding protein
MSLTHDSMMERRRDGRPEEALRTALAFLSENAADHYAWYCAASLCIELGGAKVGFAGLNGAGEELAESGNLPMALVCIREIDGAGGDSTELKGLVSILYGKGSSRLKDRLMPPPPLPGPIDEEKLENFRPESSFLVQEADRIMDSASESARLAREMGGKRPDLPYFPMFGALGPEGFMRLVNVFEVTRFKRGDVLMEQGKPSDELLLMARGEVVVYVDLPGKDRNELAVLGPGTLLGEMGMVARTPRSATVEAQTDGIGLRAPIDVIEAMADDIPEVAEVIVKFCEIRLLENLMTVSPILNPLGPADRSKVVALFDRLYLDPGEVAITQGDEGKGIFLVVSGEMGVLRAAESKASSGETIYLTTLKAGDVFGEISTVMKKPATATVRAVTGTALLFLPRDRFMKLTKAFPAIFQKVYEISSQREEEIERICESKASPGNDLIE